MCGNLEPLFQDILGNRKGMLRIGGSLEFSLLLTAYTDISPNTLDPRSLPSNRYLALRLAACLVR